MQESNVIPKLAFDEKSWITGFEMLGQILTYTSSILNSAPIKEFTEQDFTYYKHLRQQFLRLTHQLEAFIPLDYEFLNTLVNVKATYPPTNKPSRVISQNYISCCLYGVFLCSAITLLVESYKKKKILFYLFRGLALGSIIGYIGAECLALSLLPIIIPTAIIGASTNYYFLKNQSFWLQTIQDLLNNMKTIKPRNDLFLMQIDSNSNDELIRLVDSLKNLIETLKSKCLSLL